MGYISVKYEEIRENRNENAKAYVYRQITRQNLLCRLYIEFSGNITRRSRAGFGMWNVTCKRGLGEKNFTIDVEAGKTWTKV